MLRTLLISALLTSTALAETWTVDDDGKADFDNIQAAVDAASDGDEIIVMPGTYTGSGQNVVEIISKSIAIIGNGEPSDIVIDGENSRRGIYYLGYKLNSINGITIKNCYADFGGGIYANGKNSISPDIFNCVIENNTATNWGGGFYGARNKIINCVISNNVVKGGGGGGLYISGDNTYIYNCIISGNIPGSYGGGGLMIGGGNNFIIEHTKIENNYGFIPGILVMSTDLTINNCWLKYNSIRNYGAPITITSTYFCACGIEKGQWTDGGGNLFLTNCDDSDSDWIPDEIDNCSLPNEDQLDCNQNGIGDVCDLAFGTSTDWDDNLIPDDCQEDCNGNGFPDEWELLEGITEDCNGNLIPDDCDISSGFDDDCNENSIPDSCDIVSGLSNDINGNMIPDECESDCNLNGYPDSWEIKQGWTLDCNTNGIPDECDLSSGFSDDCNQNGLPDECDIATGKSQDDNGDNIPDECQCFGDVNSDWNINVIDVLIVIASWGEAGPLGDANNDGIVDVSDLLLVISNWGPCE